MQLKTTILCKLSQFQKDNMSSFFCRTIFLQSFRIIYVHIKVEIQGMEKKREGNGVEWICSTQYIAIRKMSKLTK